MDVLIPENEAIQLVANNLREERNWLLSTETSFVLQEIKWRLQNCLDCLSIQIEKGKRDDKRKYFDMSNRLCSFEAQHGALKGFLSIDGWTIKEAEINFKIGRYPQFKTKIVDLNPWILSQIQDAHNFIKLAQRHLINCGTQPSASAITSACSSPERFTSFTNFHKDLLEKTCGWVSRARQVLLLPNPSRFPQSISSTNSFAPSLPNDVVIDLGVSGSYFILSIYCLHIKGSKQAFPSIASSLKKSASTDGFSHLSPGNVPSPTPPKITISNANLNASLQSHSNPTVSLHERSSSNPVNYPSSGSPSGNSGVPVLSIVGQSLKFQDTTVEVFDHAEVLCEAPNVDLVFEFLDEIYSLSTDLLDKIRALS